MENNKSSSIRIVSSTNNFSNRFRYEFVSNWDQSKSEETFGIYQLLENRNTFLYSKRNVCEKKSAQ